MAHVVATPMSTSPKACGPGEWIATSPRNATQTVFKERRISIRERLSVGSSPSTDEPRRRTVSWSSNTNVLTEASTEEPISNMSEPSQFASEAGGCNRIDFRKTGWSSSFDAEANRNEGGQDRAGESFMSLFQDYTNSESDSPRVSGGQSIIDDSATSRRNGSVGTMSDMDWPQPSEEEIVCSPAGSSIPDMAVSPGNDFEIIEREDFSFDLNHPKTTHYLQMIGKIPTERGLDFQNFTCDGTGCGRMIGIIYGKARVCSFTGCYFCHSCHENEESCIPARMLHNWDFRKHKVSKFAKQFLLYFDEQPVINIMEENPKIYSKMKIMQELRDLRTKLLYLKSYLFTCKKSVAEDLRLRIWPHEYLFDKIHVYSPADLRNAQSGTLVSRLKKIIDYAMKHVYSCPLCKQKGYVCEICNDDKVIYPFEMDSTWRCEKCTAVYHKHCKKVIGLTCNKCERIRKRKSDRGPNNDSMLLESIDFVVVPDEQLPIRA